MTLRLGLTAVLWLLSPVLVLGDLNVVIVLDDSGSMDERMRSDRRTRKIDAAKSALRTVLARLSDDAHVGLVVLNDPGGWLLPLGPLNRPQLNQMLDRIEARGGTPLGQFMKVGADGLLAARERQRYGTYKLLIVTDGEAGDQHLVEQYLPDILSRGLVVDVIGVDMQQDHSLATKVPSYRRADDPRSLERAIADVVLGESTADARDAGASDFELLSGFPSDLAAAALQALAQVGNQPIGQPAGGAPAAPEVAQAPFGQSAPAAATPGHTVTAPPPSGQTAVGVVGTLLGACCFMTVGMLVFLLLTLRVVGKK